MSQATSRSGNTSLSFLTARMAGLSGTSAGVPVASLSGEEEAAERRKRWRERGVGGGEEMRGVREGMEEGDMHLLIHVHIHIEDFGDKTHSHSIV